MSIFDDLTKEVEDGMFGRNSGIPMGFSRLNNHVSIRKSNNYLIGGYTGLKYLAQSKLGEFREQLEVVNPEPSTNLND